MNKHEVTRTTSTCTSWSFTVGVPLILLTLALPLLCCPTQDGPCFEDGLESLRFLGVVGLLDLGLSMGGATAVELLSSATVSPSTTPHWNMLWSFPPAEHSHLSSWLHSTLHTWQHTHAPHAQHTQCTTNTGSCSPLAKAQTHQAAAMEMEVWCRREGGMRGCVDLT